MASNEDNNIDYTIEIKIDLNNPKMMLRFEEVHSSRW